MTLQSAAAQCCLCFALPVSFYISLVFHLGQRSLLPGCSCTLSVVTASTWGTHRRLDSDLLPAPLPTLDHLTAPDFLLFLYSSEEGHTLNFPTLLHPWIIDNLIFENIPLSRASTTYYPMCRQRFSVVPNCTVQNQAILCGQRNTAHPDMASWRVVC